MLWPMWCLGRVGVAMWLPWPCLSAPCNVFAVCLPWCSFVCAAFLPCLCRGLAVLCCVIVVTLPSHCCVLAVGLPCPWMSVLLCAREGCRHESRIYNVICISSHRMPHICCDEHVHVALPSIWKGHWTVCAKHLPTPNHTTRWRGNQVTFSACSRTLLPPAWPWRCNSFALRPACLMFLLGFALAMPMPCHVPVLRRCAAAVRAVPREYRARSACLLWFAILLFAFAMRLKSFGCACHTFAVRVPP